MSYLSGKCDVFDSYIAIPNNEERTKYEIENTRFFVDGKEREINTVKDLIPFFPCIIGMSCWSGGKEGSGSVWINSRSYVRQESDESMQLKLRDAKKVYRRLKRKKEEITPQSVYDGWYHWNAPKNSDTVDPTDWEISRLVAYGGEDAYIGSDILNRPLHRMERKELFDLMIKNGYTLHQAIGWVYENDLNALEDGYEL